MQKPDPAADPPFLLITTQQLQYLAAVAAAPTWAGAATELGVSPSALSQGLAELERRLGLPLFERKGRRRVVRPAAAEVVAYAQRVVAQTRQLGLWAAAVRNGEAGRLRVGMIDAAAVAHYPEALAAFRAAHPDLDLRLTIGPSAALLARLRAAELDVVVVVDPPPPVDDLTIVALVTEELALYAPSVVDIDTTGDHPETWGPFVLFPEGSHTRRTIVSALRELGATVDIVAESHQPEVLRALVELGQGWTVLPATQAESGPNPLTRARTRPIAWRRLVAVTARDRIATPAAEALLTALVSVPIDATPPDTTPPDTTPRRSPPSGANRR